MRLASFIASFAVAIAAACLAFFFMDSLGSRAAAPKPFVPPPPIVAPKHPATVDSPPSVLAPAPLHAPDMPWLPKNGKPL